MISHDMNASVKYASHILHIGENIFFGTKDEYVNSSHDKLLFEAEGGEE
jgi:zinc transport system ATP-binding protein